MLTYQQLAQTRNVLTSPVKLYSANSSENVQVYLKFVNTSTEATLLSVFHDANGTTYDETTSICWEMRIEPGYMLEMCDIFINSENENIAYKTSVSNAITATVYGAVRT